MQTDLNITAWPADRVERRAVAELLPYTRNARTHSSAQIAKIAAAIEEWGCTNPVLVDEVGSISDGGKRKHLCRNRQDPGPCASDDEPGQGTL